MRRWLVLMAALAACRGAPPQFAGGVLAPLDIDSGRLLVRARIDGQPRVLVLDTGASITSISTATARDLGIAVDSTIKINDSISAQLGTLHSLSIGLADHEDVPVAIVDMPNARDSRVVFHGILGLDVLARHDVVLDLGRHTIALYPPGVMGRRQNPTMQRIEIQRGSYGLITFDVTFDHRTRIPAILDLGAPTSVINNAAAVLLGVHRPAFHPKSLSVGDTNLGTRYMLINDLPVFARFGLANRPAILLGSDAFNGRALVIAYRDRVAFVSR